MYVGVLEPPSHPFRLAPDPPPPNLAPSPPSRRWLESGRKSAYGPLLPPPPPLCNRDIIGWPTHKLHHNEIGEPQAWTIAVTYFVSRLNITM